MNSPSQKPSAPPLNAYLAHVEWWDPAGGDAFLLLSTREWLAAHGDTLSTAERAAMQQADARVLALADASTDTTPDAQFLHLTAQTIRAEQPGSAERASGSA
jgi:hypothetical protein